MINWKYLLFIYLVSLNVKAQHTFTVFFDFNEDFPNATSVVNLTEWLVKNPKIEVYKLEGYCDSIDTQDYNKKLAQRRIQSVELLLSKSNVKLLKNLDRVPFGKEFKQSVNQSENRKVVIYFNVTESTPILTAFSETIRKAKKGEIVKLPNIYFYNNSAQIVPKSKDALFDLLCVMEENPNLKIEIQGHICCQTVHDSDNISTARAKAIYNFLVKNKISPKRLSYKGYGISRPVHKIPERNETEADENRRVEILIVDN